MVTDFLRFSAMRRIRQLFPTLAVLAIVLAAGTVAEACPMCAETVAADDNLPKAYMYSILFMLTMPALVFTGFGVAIFRAFKKHEAAQDATLTSPQATA